MNERSGLYTDADGKIVIENRHFYLRINERAIAESLILKSSGRELIDANRNEPIFSLTEKRPFNNEIKLMYPNKRTTFGARSLSLSEGRLVVYFDLVTFGATVEVDITDEYVVLRLGEFILSDRDFCVGPTTDRKLNMDAPPVDEFRLLALPVRRMSNFGEWLNVTWDDGAAVALIGTAPHTRIDHERLGNGLTLTADAVRGIKLVGCSAALIVTEGKESMLDAIDRLEEDYGLPRGVKSRRSGLLNKGAFWTTNANPANIDKILSIAKQAGIKSILFYYTCFYERATGYGYCGNYDYSSHYPNGEEDIKAMLDKIKAEGISPGLHFLHTHIGIESRYVTPVADHRLNLTGHFTLSRSLSENDTTVYVENPTTDAPMHPDCRVLQFGGELISYESYTNEYPYAFVGCKRGHFNTNITSHPIGQIGGTLDVSEFGATSVYLDQNSSLQDEIAEKLARLYNLGFEYCYFDGSEGVNAPFDYHVSNAQYRVLKKFKHPPIYCEGAAKTHFGWHYMSGGNAFDVFPCDTFKKLILEFPFAEAKRMREDFTRVNFGWWNYYVETEPDIYEFGTSRAASFDCPGTIFLDMDAMEKNPRTKDNLEVIRRWEEYRPMLTEEQKQMLRSSTQEHTLIKLGYGYALLPYDRISAPEGITAYVFEYGERAYCTLWHKTGKGTLSIPTCKDDISYTDEFVGAPLPIRTEGENCLIEVSDKAYLSAASRQALVEAIGASVLN